ncbi:MAG: acyl carrier protein [Pacificimonas sp.]
MTETTPTRESILPRLIEIIEPFNKKGIELTAETSFANDLELDSLTVMDLVAEIEDEYDILLPVNMLPDLETIGDVAGAVAKIKAGE